MYSIIIDSFENGLGTKFNIIAFIIIQPYKIHKPISITIVLVQKYLNKTSPLSDL